MSTLFSLYIDTHTQITQNSLFPLKRTLRMFGYASCVSLRQGVGCIQQSVTLHDVYTHSHKQYLERKHWSSRCAWPRDPRAELLSLVCNIQPPKLQETLGAALDNVVTVRKCAALASTHSAKSAWFHLYCLPSYIKVNINYPKVCLRVCAWKCINMSASKSLKLTTVAQRCNELLSREGGDLQTHI